MDHIFVITRWALIIREWIRPDETEGVYLERLYDDDRMILRNFLFREMSLKSVAAQQVDGAVVHFLPVTSSTLPPHHMRTLKAALAEAPDVKSSPVIVPRDGDWLSEVRSRIHDILKEVDSPCGYATVWLDDDDALSSRYASYVAEYLRLGVANLSLTFSLGISGRYDHTTRRITNVSNFWSPRTTPGLCMLRRFDPSADTGSGGIDLIFDVGDSGHARIDQKFGVIDDSRNYAFMLLDHGDNVSQRGETRLQDVLPRAPAEALADFSHIDLFAPDLSLSEKRPNRLGSEPSVAKVYTRQKTELSALRKNLNRARTAAEAAIAEAEIARADAVKARSAVDHLEAVIDRLRIDADNRIAEVTALQARAARLKAHNDELRAARPVARRPLVRRVVDRVGRLLKPRARG